jgi:hypothetical protein
MTINAGLMTSNTPEWYTPADLLNEIRDFLGGAYYDPCPPRLLSNAPFVNGLATRWADAGLPIYVNPPYGREIRAWALKFATEPMVEGIALVPARTDTGWWQAMWPYHICFLRGRLKFAGPQGATNSAPFPSALVYIGSRGEAFAAAFAHRGVTVTRLADMEVTV